MRSFEDYLEKNAWVLNSHSDTKVITIHTLGEWAWKEFSDAGPSPSMFLSNYDFVQIAREKMKKQMYLGFWMLLDISIGCLGKQEVEKRLSLLSDSSESIETDNGDEK